MMHIYTDILFENRSATSCTMNSHFRLEEFDASGVRMPVQVHLNMSGDARGTGAQEVILKPKDKTTVTVETISRGPYDPGHRCATQIRINNRLFRYKTISCSDEVFVSGFRDQQ